MRLGIDLFPFQQRSAASRGIGQFSRSLIAALRILDPSPELVHYAVADRPVYGGLPGGLDGPTWLVGMGPCSGHERPTALDRHLSARGGNPDGLDAILSTCPLPSVVGWHENGPRRVAIWYDLITELYPEVHMKDPGASEFYERTIAVARGYDALMTLSRHAKDDLVTRRGFDPDKIHVIGSGYGAGFRPAADGDEVAEDRRLVSALGVAGPFVLNVGGLDPRKGTFRLIDAWALLPEWIRMWDCAGRAHQLVFAYDGGSVHEAEVRRYAREAGLASDEVMLTGWVPDRTLAALYRRASLHCFPSLYEGFGLTILEAMAAGCPVLCGDNSSQPEVGGRAARYVDASSPACIAHEIAEIVDDLHATGEGMRLQGLREAARYSWEATARSAMEVLGGVAAGVSS